MDLEFVRNTFFTRDDGRQIARSRSVWSTEIVGMTEPARSTTFDEITEIFLARPQKREPVKGVAKVVFWIAVISLGSYWLWAEIPYFAWVMRTGTGM
jgi:hypothetical protein